jgi:hypothetical protein
MQVRLTPPSEQPLGLGPTTRQNGAWVKLIDDAGKPLRSMKSLLQLNPDGGQIEQSRPGKERPCAALILFFSRFFTRAFASQRGLHTLLLAGLQVKGVTLDLLDDVFLLHLALETA